MPDTKIQDTITEEQAKLDDIRQEQRSILQSINQIKLDTEAAQRELTQALSDRDIAQESLDALRADIDGLSTARAGKLSELSDLNDQLRIATSALETAKTNADKINKDSAQSLKDTQAGQDKIIADAQSKVDDLTAEKIALESEIAPFADQAARLQSQIADAEAQLVRINKLIDDAKASLSTLQANQSVISENVRVLQATSDTLTADIATKTAISSGLDTEMATKRAELSGIGDQIKTAKESLKVNNAQNAEFLKMKAGLMAGTGRTRSTCGISQTKIRRTR
jgi:chromosome segregation ATPase